MNKTGYLVWVNDDSFWHKTLAAAERRFTQANLRGQDTLIVEFAIEPFLIPLKKPIYGR